MRAPSISRRVLSREFLAAALIAFVTLALATLACTSRPSSSVAPQQWWTGRGPVVPHDTFPSDCSLCHLSSSWRELRADFVYDHERETGTPLVGAHARAECLRCHNDRGPVQVFAIQGCAGCHDDPHRGELGRECATCHTEEDWRARGSLAEHDHIRFPLVGAHRTAACWRCHPNAAVGQFIGATTECESCHAADVAAARNPNHFQQGFARDCGRCHVPTTWRGAGFNHGYWPLTGHHKYLDCSDCHQGGDYVSASKQCFACHKGQYNSAQNPNHVALGLSTLCQRCHSTSNWDV